MEVAGRIRHEDASRDRAVSADAGGGDAGAATFVSLLLIRWEQEGDVAVVAIDAEALGVIGLQTEEIAADLAQESRAEHKITRPAASRDVL